jgi:hypothetical protein
MIDPTPPLLEGNAARLYAFTLVVGVTALLVVYAVWLFCLPAKQPPALKDALQADYNSVKTELQGPRSKPSSGLIPPPPPWQ